MKSFLLLLQAYLLGRTGSKIVGLMLLLSLVWWGGPYAGLTSETWRLAIIIAILVMALAVWGIRVLLVRRRAAKFHDELRCSQKGADDQPLDLEELQRKMNEAVATLKSSDLGVGCRGSAALYVLPWLMIIGPSAAGKTTLLRHSGLHFPYAGEGDIDIRGFGGTRNCDWWFSNEAVLLDTAGRYTTEPNDHKEWKAFLGLLRKHRRRMPINGVLVAISLEDLLTGDQKAIEQHVKIIRDRVDELISDLGCLAPVYLVVTKCDLLHGFASFFEDLSDHDRQQVWGTWVGDQPEPEGLAAAFEGRLNQLYERLCAMRLRKMAMQRRFQAKRDIHEFPAQFQAACENLKIFARLLFKPNPYQETPRFCGVYFTSATQEGTPLQRILGQMRQAFGYVEDHSPGQRTATRSFFIKKLFQDIVFPNVHGASKSRQREVVGRWLKSSWVVASLAVIAAGFMVLSTSLTSNTLLLQRGVSAAQQLNEVMLSAQARPEQGFAALDELYFHYRDLLEYERKLPWHLTLGVYEGGTQLEPTRKLLLEGLDLAFFQTVAKVLEFRLENHIRRWKASNSKVQESLSEPFYEDLKAYLMLGEPEKLDLAYAVPVLSTIWLEELSRGESAANWMKGYEERLRRLVHFHLSHLAKAQDRSEVEPWPVRDTIIAQARSQLRIPPNASRLYAQMMARASQQLEVRTLEDLIKGYDFGLVRSRTQIPGALTEQGWYEFIQPEIAKVVSAASRGDWVTGFVPDLAMGKPMSEAAGSEADAAALDDIAIDHELSRRLEREIRQLYFADYAEAWYGLLESVRFASFNSLDDAARKFVILARSDGPIGELMRVVSRNINLYEGAPTAVPLDVDTGETGIAARKPVAELQGALRDLRKFCDPGDKMTVSLLINQYLLAISSVQSEIERMSAAADVSREAARYSAEILNGGGANSELYKGWVSTSSLLGGIEARTRRVAGNLLMTPLRQTWQLILDETRKDLERSWRNGVHAVYSQKLQGRFPFVPAGRDVALMDVADFFRPDDGVLWSFVHNNLKPYLNKTSNGWRQKTWLEQGPDFNQDLLRTLEQAQAISSSLFRRGSHEPEVQFYLYPVPSRGVSEMYLETNGQDYRYRNEPQEWRKFHWPGDMDRVGAKVRGVVGPGTARGELSHEGVWGLFHLLRQGRVNVESGTQYLVSWEIDGNTMPVTVQFRIRADREQNVFERELFSRMQIPETLF